ncbi:MAG: ATP-binding protein [Bacteroidetes bacterium]|nr:ATP-binding protein [Bacteroidota bacterium]MBU1718233.1 ATP-binding protein [Bacteroidota bacterium]
MNTTLESLSTINYWEKKPEFSLGFIRASYLKSLEDASGSKLIKVIVGQRRTGKSYIVRQLIDVLITKRKVNPRNVFYLNKELFEYDTIATASDLANIIKQYEIEFKPKGKIYILIDEVQNIENWEKLTVSLAQNPVKDYEIIITGSNSSLLSGELASLLSGRFIVTEVFPFSYVEYLDYSSLPNTRENFLKYITTSGLPEVFNLHTDEVKRHYFQSLKDTILLKDIMYRYKIRDYVLLGDLFLFLTHNVGSLTSVPAIIKYFKSKMRQTDYTTISNYISFLEEAFIIHQAPRLSLKNKELLSGEKKYYLNDMGFRNYLYPQLINDVGGQLENVVFMHLRNAGYEVRVGSATNFEIDFIATKGVSTMYVQVSYLLVSEKTKEREFGALEKVKDNFPKFVVSMDDIKLYSPAGIIHEKIWDFIYELK